MAGGLKEVRSRITSVQSTRQITQAMKMVSAAKLRRAQDAITQMRPYAEKLQEILANVSSTLDSSEGVYSVEREVNNVLVIAITSNRGLCGAFNNNIVKEVKRLIADDYAGKNVHVLSLGKKASDAFSKTSHHTTEGYSDTPYEIFDDLTFGNAGDVATIAMSQFADAKYDRVVVVYNSFKNAAMQDVSTEQMLPVVAKAEKGGSAATEYIFEPNREEIVENIIPNSIRLQLFKALLDSHASEHGARMTAMHKATDNASDLLKELKLTYNKARQASITNEILEIVGGAEALNG
ncbi:MAG: ATP synthase F1 subunit gamma [Flavobacteriales bacterium]|nr:ATP synthase F1 subunit gamma [Flavobacteriales bacterium]